MKVGVRRVEKGIEDCIQLYPPWRLAVSYIREKTQKYNSKEIIVPRIAGGWVRDILRHLILGIPLNPTHVDMDIAVEGCTGISFAVDVLERDASLIHSNPAQSKHLDTAICSIHGVSLDMVGLRSEKLPYPPHSRIPELHANATLSLDAQRRDFTMNACYYNLLTKKLEDPTEKGIRDITASRICAPLHANVSLSHDPLRALRAIRMSRSMNCTISKDVYIALQDPETHASLITKVSRDRMGIEMRKMMQLKNGYLCFQDMIQCGLYQTMIQPLQCHDRLNQGLDHAERESIPSLLHHAVLPFPRKRFLYEYFRFSTSHAKLAHAIHLAMSRFPRQAMHSPYVPWAYHALGKWRQSLEVDIETFVHVHRQWYPWAPSLHWYRLHGLMDSFPLSDAHVYLEKGYRGKQVGEALRRDVERKWAHKRQTIVRKGPYNT